MRSKRKKERQQQQESAKSARKQEERSFKKTIVHVAQTLGETDWKPRTQIERIVEQLGSDFALTKLQETEHLEAEGGLMLPDGSRRRTKGGVFFYLVRQWLKEQKRQADIKEIFYKNMKEPPKEEQTDAQPEAAKAKTKDAPDKNGDAEKLEPPRKPKNTPDKRDRDRAPEMREKQTRHA